MVALSLAFLEHHGVYHGNIHPYNIMVSDDGFHLLIGDFVPPSNPHEKTRAPFGFTGRAPCIVTS